MDFFESLVNVMVFLFRKRIVFVCDFRFSWIFFFFRGFLSKICVRVLEGSRKDLRSLGVLYYFVSLSFREGTGLER